MVSYEICYYLSRKVTFKKKYERNMKPLCEYGTLKTFKFVGCYYCYTVWPHKRLQR